MTIHPDLLTNISHRDVAIELWEHIRKMFSVSNGPRNQKMKADLATCKQSGMSGGGILWEAQQDLGQHKQLQTTSHMYMRSLPV